MSGEQFGRSSTEAMSTSEDPPPPSYGESHGHVHFSQGGLDTVANVGDDGRVNISIGEHSTARQSLLTSAIRKQLQGQITDQTDLSTPVSGDLGQEPRSPPPLNIVIQVVGSRGDVQPFVALGKVLHKTHGHRVRIATHPTFREFVTEHDLEFFSIGGDPKELMAFMVKNPGLMPGKDALSSGDIGKRRKGMYEIMRGCWRSCFEAGDGTGPPVSDNQPHHEFIQNEKPFVADAIIANPPSFAHVHCAEKLGIPLHLMFTMPWSPTQAFPHPLADIQTTSTDASMTNFLSYALVELMTWQGLGDLVNRFREGTLDLDPLSLTWAPGMANRLRVPYTYCWSPSLIPKPRDWAPHISVSGFFFLETAERYEPPDDLARFLDAGPPPVYIGFGSIVVDDPDAMTKMIFEAVQKTGQRALVSKGWGGLGSGSLAASEDVFMLGNVPHDWLFRRVSCVVHHGGAGTTAAGIALGKPTVVVPFFGDQPFWGAMIARAGAGPDPIAYKDLTADALATSIKFSLQPSVLDQAQALGRKVSAEAGSESGAKSFHEALNVEQLSCSLLPGRAAAWVLPREGLRLSPLAAAVLGSEGLIDLKDVQLLRSKEYEADNSPWEPILGGGSALVSTISSLMMGAADIPPEIFRAFSKKPQREDSQVSGSSGSGDKAEKDQTGKEAAASSSSQPTPPTSDPSGKPNHPFTMNSAIDAGQGAGRIVEGGMKSPMDFTLALAKGFHNAPKLYGDSTVRPLEKVTDLRSGLRAARKGLGHGLYDGISGLITQPVEGAKKEGFGGFIKGFGKGIGGVVFKPGAAFWGVPGYTFQGIYKELRKHFGTNVQSYIMAARTAQGHEQLQSLSKNDRSDIVERWSNAPKARGNAEDSQKPSSTSDASSSNQSGTSSAPQGMNVNSAEGWTAPAASAEEYEEAIAKSLEATLTGNAEEDALVEHAIRASLAELCGTGNAEKASGTSDLKSAIPKKNTSGGISDTSSRENDYTQKKKDDPNVDSDSDENLQEALRRSKHTDSEESPELRRALEESEATHREQETERQEEQAVVNYMMRQSLQDGKGKGA